MDVYGMAWKNLEKKIAATRRRSISKADLTKWQLEALEEAVDRSRQGVNLLAAPIPPEGRPHA
ncbi:hypothetical protein LCGC14_1215540 [marine sediment metagenome]|uniref:Uncharacterized protein n=1 Tax=marine sediment metagenome TaxID=412755 RepID=A0A0F9PHE7_9ZZZZ